MYQISDDGWRLVATIRGGENLGVNIQNSGTYSVVAVDITGLESAASNSITFEHHIPDNLEDPDELEDTDEEPSQDEGNQTDEENENNEQENPQDENSPIQMMNRVPFFRNY